MNVFDFDNTIYDGESAFDFFVFCARKYPRMIKFFPRVISVVILYKLCRITREGLLDRMEKYDAEILRIAGDIRVLVREFWDKNESKIKPYYSKIRRDDDVIISASFDFLLDEIMQRVGIKNCICSKMDLETGRVTQLCFGDEKVRLFKEAYPDGTVDCFFTDSMNDLPMTKLAKKSYIVKGNKIREKK